MGNILKVGVSWTPQGIDKTLKTKFSVGVGGLPTRIAVTKLPNKVDYVDGQTINPSGIIVHAYYENGDDYGTVLNSELTFEPMSADATKAESGYTSDLDTGIVSQPILISNAVQFRSQFGGDINVRIEPGNNSFLIFAWPYPNWFYVFTCSKNPLPTARVICVNNENPSKSYDAVFDRSADHVKEIGRSQGTVNGKTVYWTEIWGHYGAGPVTVETGTPIRYTQPLDSGDRNSYVEANLVYTILYGDVMIGEQPITVKWNRPADKEVLTTTFNVNVSGGS